MVELDTRSGANSWGPRGRYTMRSVSTAPKDAIRMHIFFVTLYGI